MKSINTKVNSKYFVATMLVGLTLLLTPPVLANETVDSENQLLDQTQQYEMSYDENASRELEQEENDASLKRRNIKGGVVAAVTVPLASVLLRRRRRKW